MTRQLRIRTVLTRMMLAMAVLAAFAAITLTALTRQLQQLGEAMGGDVESVHLAHEAQNDLSSFDRVHDSTMRTNVAADLRWRLAQARELAAGTREGELLATAAGAADAYLRALDSGADETEIRQLQAAADRALRRYLDVSVQEARRGREMAARWDVVAELVAALFAIAVFCGGGWLVWWVRARAMEPMLRLTATVDRFGRGDTQARADGRGPVEVSEMGACFNRMAEALASQRSAEMAHLAAVAHDLRNPLWALQLSLRAARSGESRDDVRAQRGLDAADRQVARLGRMIEDLLDASNIEAGHLELRCGLYDLGALAREHAEQIGATSTRHRIECRVPTGPLEAVVDPMRIGQVVTNLLGNAIKYSPEGGVVELEVRRVEDAAVVEITDHGLGIAERDLGEIFEPFRRLEPGKRAGAGTGLGLFVVRRIVEEHGGTIAVESTPGRGSTFRVRLPLVQPAGASSVAVPQEDARAEQSSPPR